MHPEIKNFWFRQCYHITSEFYSNKTIFHGEKGHYNYENYIHILLCECPIDITNVKSIYFFQDQKYSEQEMLKLIKLKAFL